MHLFLHGFLGDKSDWDPVLSHLPKGLKKIAIDLPGHGLSPITEDFALSIKEEVGHAAVLVGYSAGGRLALELKARFPDDFGRVVALSAHPGITSEDERKNRYLHDLKWARMLRESAFEDFLEKWYAQPLFTPPPTNVLERRQKGNPETLAQFLEQFSVGIKSPPELHLGTVFVCGKEDLKYVQLYRKLGRTFLVKHVEKACHAVHIEEPKAIANIVMEIENEYSRNTCLLMD